MMSNICLTALLLIGTVFWIESAEKSTPPTYEQLKEHIVILEQFIAVQKHISREIEAHNIILETHNEQLKNDQKKIMMKLKKRTQQMSKLRKEYEEYRERVEYEEGIRKNEEWIIEKHEQLSLKKFQHECPYT